MTDELLEQVREGCLALPEATEQPGPMTAFKVRDKTFAWFLDNHHGDGRIAVWCKAPPGAQQILVGDDPQRFFVPPYVGPKGWVGIRLDVGQVDWDEVAEVVADSYRMTASKR